MQAYKFDARISENGIISLPKTIPDLYGKKVELFIIIPPRRKIGEKRKISASEFITHWTGVF